jgi:hypothetical protein
MECASFACAVIAGSYAAVRRTHLGERVSTAFQESLWGSEMRDGAGGLQGRGNPIAIDEMDH